MRPLARLSTLTAFLVALGAAAAAQDRRTIVEPRFPAACAVLEAHLEAPGGLLSEASESRSDTQRLQEAIDRCPSGQAVRLRRAGERYVFLSGPLRLKAGVTLWIDAHAALFGSRNPRDYDVEPGSCGILAPTNARGRGCRPLILAEDAPGSGVMGDGAIDGRGGAVMLGQDLTWWELAKKATHRVEVSLDNVTIDGLEAGDLTAAHADVRIGPRRGNFVPSGEDVNVMDAGTAPAAPLSCDGRFAPFPDVRTAPAAAVKVPPEDPTLYVAADGTGDYWSIQRAIDFAPATGATISVAPGVYRERLRITKPGIHIRSPYDDPSRTVVVFDASAGTAGATLKSATVEVQASDFLAENVTFANDWNATHPQQPQGSQAVALKVTGDRAVFRNVRILGNQDTLYVGTTDCEGPNGRPCTPARAYFEGCHVEGNVDFIFGDGKAFFEGCVIHSTPHEVGFVTAQGKHYPEQDSAFVFHRCRLTAEPGVAGVWLGRPWRDFASVLFLETEMGDHVERAGWREWHPGETKRLETASFAEWGSWGPGAAAERRDPHARTLTAEEAARLALRAFLAGTDGWNPALPRGGSTSPGSPDW